MADRGAAIFANSKSVPEAELNLRVGDMSVQERQDGPAFEPSPYSSRNTRDATGPRLELSNLEILELFLHHDGIWTMLEEVGAIVEADAPASRAGRKRESGVIDIVLFDLGSWVYGSWQKTHNNLNDPKNWERLVKATEEAWPDHPLRRLSPKPPTRSKHYRARGSYLSGDLFETMREKFRAVVAKAAVEMGMFDPKSGSFTRPAKSQIVQGDATWMPAASKIHRSKAYDPRTGRTRRHDPNADYYHDRKDKKHRTGPGRTLVKIMAHNSHPQERLIIDAEFMPPDAHPARKGRNDADFAAAMLLRFIEENPNETQGCYGLAYDMAGDSGVKDLLQDHGLHGVIKVPRSSSGGYGSVILGKHDFTAVDGSSFPRTVYAADGSACVRYVDANGTGVFVELQRMQTKRNRLKSSTLIYSRYKIPDEPVVDQAHVGATTWVRHNSTREERQAKPHRRRTRALSTIAESEPAFKVHGARQTTESSNSDIKSRLSEKRLRTYTDSDQRLNVLTYQMLWLVTAQAAYRRRTTGSPSPQRLPAGEEPIPLAA